MSEHDSKFNLGDNSDGYTRSVSSDGSSYSFDNFTQRPKKQTPAGNSPKGKKAPQKKLPQQRQSAPVPNTPKPKQPQKKSRRPKPESELSSIRQKELNQRMPQQNAPHRHRNPMRQPPQATSRTKSEENRMHTAQRRKQTKLKRIVSYAGIALFVVGVLIALSLTVLFPIREINVVGSGYYPNKQVAAASGLEQGENIIRCKAERVSDTLSKALPYIDHAEVKRSVSGKVTITVTETTGKYAVLYGEQ
ncbi:MAG TPA: hypothetical protein DDY98_08625, partial [Ruminococcaceae bacterium]|nr:hypothetical protein [Oscillospiraceae bacterium]